MRLPFFRPKDTASEPKPPQRPQRSPAAAAAPEDLVVAAARTQARRRLVGAVLLLAVGVIGFPLLFETQPRPLPQDTPILLPPTAPATRAAGSVGATATAPAPTLPAVPADAGAEPVASAPEASAPAASRPMPAAATPPAAPAASPPAPAAAPTPASGRWVVQVGAYNDMERLRAARARLQLLGYASYTQDVDSPTGKRTRVRVGPFKSRAEADAVAARVKTAGLQAAVLAL
ncbi:MAG: SPOR domain-containing protein [Betaproteobacteria bacterium]